MFMDFILCCKDKTIAAILQLSSDDLTRNRLSLTIQLYDTNVLSGSYGGCQVARMVYKAEPVWP